MIALKAQWSVQAGLVLGEPMPEFSRAWSYSSRDYENDGGTQEGLRAEGSKFLQCQEDAHRYAKLLEQGGMNWVTLHYVWA